VNTDRPGRFLVSARGTIASGDAEASEAALLDR
jgi:hypothetical protein